MPEENYWFRRHEVAYEYVRTLVHGLTVEVGCGEGYGTALLSGAARTVVGIDYDRLTVAHAARTYPAAGFVRGNLAALPVAGGTADVVVALQVIEHVWDHPQFLAECRRVLQPGGRLIVSTPNRLTFSPGRDTPANLFHTKEFTAAELVGLLTRCGFGIAAAYGLFAGPRLREYDDRHGGSFVEAQLAAAPDDWPAELRADVASVSTADFAISAADIDAVLGGTLDGCLDLLVVARLE